MQNQEPERQKQWDVKSIGIEAVKYSYWGMHPELMTEFLRLPEVQELDLEPGEKNLVKYRDLKKIIGYLHQHGIDTTVLSTAVRQLIDGKTGRNHAKK